MFKPKLIQLAVATALATTAGVAQAEIEVSGYVKNETAIVTGNRQFIGEAKNTADTSSHHDRVMKFENSARIFVNGEFGEESSWHLDLNAIYDSEAVNDDWRGHMDYSQQDWLREAFIDTTIGDIALRIGKQQVVWGTADGIKLLDIINPTDYREFNQNLPEDARIPVWMVNAEMPVGDGGNLQMILSQSEHNKIAGIAEADNEARTPNFWYPGGSGPKGVDVGHPFMFKGIDTIVGGVNGFLNIGPAMGDVTTTFYGGGFTNPDDNPLAEWFTVGGFTSLDAATANGFGCPGGLTGAGCLEAFTEISNGGVTNLIDVVDPTALGNTPASGWNTGSPTSMWEYMPNATFATFNTFVGMSTAYDRDHPDDTDMNFGARYRDTTEGGTNWSLNYAYVYDPNPVINVHWESAPGGAFGAGRPLRVVSVDTSTFAPGGFPLGGPYPAGSTYVQQLQDRDGNCYGAPTSSSNVAADCASVGPARMVFRETLERVHNLGASFDTSFETEMFGPVVLRGEFLYQRDVQTPIIDRTQLGHGNLSNAALYNIDADFFKYVIGLDITVATNMLVSTQFIQFRNLDYVDDNYDTNTGASCGLTPFSAACGRYSADPYTMHLTNGFLKAEENKEFVSVYLSKPFGSEQQGRWNNILILEDTGGKWNRFDVEWGFTDELVGSFEVNTYWGEEDSWFGQLHNSSNMQVGLKYIFD